MAVGDGFVVMADAPVTAAQTTAASATTVAIARVVLFVIRGRRHRGPAAAAMAIAGLRAFIDLVLVRLELMRHVRRVAATRTINDKRRLADIYDNVETIGSDVGWSAERLRKYSDDRCAGDL